MTLRYAAIAATMMFAATSAYGQTFSFTVQNETPTAVGGVSPEGIPYGGAYWKGKSEATFADGHKTSSTSTCLSMSQPPRDSIFMAHGACNVVSNDGTFDVVMGCNYLTKDGSETTCVGSLLGKSGAYANRRGTISLHGKGTTGTGAGLWNQ